MFQRFQRWPKKVFIITGCVLSFSALMAARTGILNGLLQSDMDGAQFKILNLSRVETGTAAMSGKQTINVNSGVSQTGAIATALDVTTGSAAAPITTADRPSVVISRREGDISGGGDGSDGPALYVVNHSTGTQQNVGVASKSTMLAGGSNDVVGMYAQAEQYGTGVGKAAFGLFAYAFTNTAVGAAIAIETQTTNFGSYDESYSPVVGVNRFIGLDLNYGSDTGKHGAVAMQVRGNQWDVGLGFMAGDPIRTADIQSDTNAVDILLAHGGTHNNGIDLRGATFTGNPFISANYRVDLSGNVFANNSLTFAAASDSGVDFGNGTTVTRRSSDGHLRLTSQSGVIEFVGHTTQEGVTSTGATGTGNTVYNNAPTLISPALGTPASGNAVNLTNIPVTSATGTLPVANGGTGDTGTALTSYAPTVTAGAGTYTSVSATGYYKTIGKAVFVRILVLIVTNGTAATSTKVTLPFNGLTGTYQFLPAMELFNTGLGGRGFIDSADTSIVNIKKYDATYLGSDSAQILVEGWYERN